MEVILIVMIVTLSAKLNLDGMDIAAIQESNIICRGDLKILQPPPPQCIRARTFIATLMANLISVVNNE